MNTHEIMLALRLRYSGAEWAFMTEVPNGTGMAKSRSADGIAMSLYPSRGLSLHGIEIKASRSDWLRELKNPQKADELAVFCDFWWIAAGSADIVKEGELPKTWGLLLPRGSQMVQKVAAKQFDQVMPVDRCFLAGILRRAKEQLIPKSEIEERLRLAKEEGAKDAKRYRDVDVQRAVMERDHMKLSLDAFCKKSGIDLASIGEWGAGDIGDVVKLLKSFQPGCERIRAVKLLDELKKATSAIDGIVSHYDLIEKTQKDLEEIWPRM